MALREILSNLFRPSNGKQAWHRRANKNQAKTFRYRSVLEELEDAAMLEGLSNKVFQFRDGFSIETAH